MIDFQCIITNGYVDASTIEAYTSKGYSFVTTVPAQLVHPRALPTDKATIFSKYTPYSIPAEETSVGMPENG